MRSIACTGLTTVVAVAGLLSSAPAKADQKVCNKTIDEINVAVGYKKDGGWIANGWWPLKAGECATVYVGDARAKVFYVRATTKDQGDWGDGEKVTFCITSKRMDDFPDMPCRDQRAGFMEVNRATTPDHILDLTDPLRRLPDIATGVIQEKCLASWEDSHQIHSVDTIIDWNYQAVKTRMKKLQHCIKLKVTGPIDISGVAKSYVDHCVNYAINDNKTIHILSGIIALGVDILSEGASGGSATAAAVTNYLYTVQDKATSCLTDTGKIEAYLEDTLKSRFDAQVSHESHWEYWDL